jgi:hypothetical protein
VSEISGRRRRAATYGELVKNEKLSALWRRGAVKYIAATSISGACSLWHGVGARQRGGAGRRRAAFILYLVLALLYSGET